MRLLLLVALAMLPTACLGGIPACPDGEKACQCNVGRTFVVYCAAMCLPGGACPGDGGSD